MAAVFQLKIMHNQDKFGAVYADAKSAVSFPLVDKHVLNEHHVIRKRHDAKHRKNVLKWRISIYHVIGLKQTRGIKNVTLKAAKTFVGVAVYCPGRVVFSGFL